MEWEGHRRIIVLPVPHQRASNVKRKLLSLSLALIFFAPANGADEDNPNPCALQWKAVIAATGTPTYEEARKDWQTCTTTAAEQKKEKFVATRDSWAASLDKLPSGGWIFLTVSADGTYAIFGSHRHATREGNVVALWFRTEYREGQSSGNESFKSLVERNMYDCVRMASKQVSTTSYRENNLEGPASSFTFEGAKTAWAPAIPGTVGDSLLDWACKSVPRTQPAKAK